MNPQHIPYYHNGQLSDIPRHQLQHPAVPPGMPLIMNQQHAFVPYAIPVPRHSRPVYSTQQLSPHLIRHPPSVAPLPIPVPQHHPPVADAVRIRYSVSHPVAPQYQNVRAEAPLAKPPVLSSAIHLPGTESAPLDLSAKARIMKPSVKQQPLDVKPIAQAAIVQFADKPLDLSKPCKRRDSHGFNQAAKVTPSANAPSSRGIAEQSGRLSTSSTATNDLEQDLAGSQNSLTSISSLIGNHPIDDILYLHCARCQSSYGSIHAFRKHFRNSHGYMPNAEDVLIQSIKATKEYVMNKNEHQPSIGIGPPKRHCVFCGWQCEQTNPSIFSKHMQEHYDGKGCYYRCIYCQHEFADPNTLRQHVIQHSTVYQHICAICCVAYSTEDQLSTHMLTHHEVRYTSRKVNLPVSVVLPSPSALVPIRHETSPKVHNQYLLPKIKPAYSQNYADHFQSKLTQGKTSASLRPQTLHPMNSYTHPSMQPKTAMLTSPRYLEANKVSSPSSAAYKKPQLGSPGMIPVPSSAETSKDGAASFNLMSLLDRVVEQGLKCTDTRTNPSSSGSITSTRRLPQAPLMPTYDHGNRLAVYNAPASSAHSIPLHPSGLVDLSHHPHSNFPLVSAAPIFFDASNARHYQPVPGHYQPAPVTVVETIDLSKRNSRLSTAQYSLSSSISPTLIDFSQKRAHIHGCPTTASSAFSTHSTYALDHSLRRNVTSNASDHQKPVLSTAKPTTTPTAPVKTPVVDITGPDFCEEAAYQSGRNNNTSVASAVQPDKSNTTTDVNKLIKEEKVEPIESAKDETMPTVSSDANSSSNMLNQNGTIKSNKDDEKLPTSVVANGTQTSLSNVDAKCEVKSDCSVAEVIISMPCVKLEDISKTVAKDQQGSGEPSETPTIAHIKVEVDTKDTAATCQSKGLNLQIPTSMAPSNEEHTINSIIDKVVKNTLKLTDTKPTVSAHSSSNSSVNQNTSKTISSNSTTPTTSSKSPSFEKQNSVTDAIPVSWAEMKDCEQSLEVDRIQAMSACRVLLNPHSFPIMNSININSLSSSDKSKTSNADSNAASLKRSADSSYPVAENGALDMSTKCSNNTSQDQSDSSACSSPKRLRIVEND